MKYILGLDIGISSIGYSIVRIDKNNNPDKIILLNSIIFHVPKDNRGLSYRKKRSYLRRTRRIRRRKKFRKHRTKSLFIKNNILTKEEINTCLNSPSSVYRLRVKGLDEKLSNYELFKVLYWFVGHRGFKLNSKANLKEKDMKMLLESLDTTNNDLKKSDYRTVGELYLKSSKFKDHKRNKYYDKGYIGATYRSLIVDEAKKILKYQLNFNTQIDNAFIKKYLDILQSQRNFDEGPGSNSPYAGNQIKQMIGYDYLASDRVRGSKASFTFNYFSMLLKINNIQIKDNILKDFHHLNNNQRKIIREKALKNSKTNFEQIKKWLNLSKDTQFNLVKYEYHNSEKNTILCDFSIVNEIRDCLPKNKNQNTKLIDYIATTLSIYKSDKTRSYMLSKYLDNVSTHKLLFLNYHQFGRLSIKTMKEIIPYLENGELYDMAVSKAGYDFNNLKINDEYINKNIHNDVVKRSINKTIKLVKYVVKKLGKPYEIHIELGRDLAKNDDEKKKIEKIQQKRYCLNKSISNEIRKMGFPDNKKNILKMKLFEEQHGIDLYSKNNDLIDISKALSGDDYYEIDHIIPYSISFSDSYNNKVLVSKKANQEKGNRIPIQYLKNNSISIKHLISNVSKLENSSKKNLLLKNDLTKDEEKYWKYRNILDTCYINKVLANYLKQNVMNSKNKVHTINGAVTAKIRNIWGITKNRNDSDIHHAVDATILACITIQFVQKVTKYCKQSEIKYNKSLWNKEDKKTTSENNIYKQIVNDFPLPYPEFKEELISRTSNDPKKMMLGKKWNNKYTNEEINNLTPITVVRFPFKKVTGAIHDETLNSAKKIDYGIISRRIPIYKLNIYGNSIGFENNRYKYKLKKDGGNQYIWNLLYKKLEERDKLQEQRKNSNQTDKKIITQKINSIFPNNSLVFEKNGQKNVIRKVKVEKNTTKGILLNNGKAIANNADQSMIRIDVFTNGKKYSLVPVYKSDITKNQLPKRYITQKKDSNNNVITKKDKFIFSLYKNDLIYVEFNKPKLIKNSNKKIKRMMGYFVRCDSYNGQICIDDTNNRFSFPRIGVTRLPKIEKYQIDYFGNYHLVNEKKREKFK